MLRWVAVCGAVVVVAVLALIALRPGEPEREAPPSRAQLIRLQERIDARWDELARRGIHVTSTGQPAARCVAVDLLNPTRPNVDYLRKRFGRHVCVSPRAGGGASACTGVERPPLRPGPVAVPDLHELGLHEATRRVVARRLTYAIGCLGDGRRRAARPSRFSPEALVRVTEQCPRPGERVRPGTEVALMAEGWLPGGFRYRFGTLTPYHTGTAEPCADGRNAAPAGLR